MCRWLAQQAEALGVEIYPGLCRRRSLYNEPDKAAVVGVATGDMGVGKDGDVKDAFEPGMELHAASTR